MPTYQVLNSLGNKVGEKTAPLIGPFQVIDTENKVLFFILCLKEIGFYITGSRLFPRVLKGLGRSGGLNGTISTCPGTSPAVW